MMPATPNRDNDDDDDDGVEVVGHDDDVGPGRSRHVRGASKTSSFLSNTGTMSRATMTLAGKVSAAVGDLTSYAAVSPELIAGGDAPELLSEDRLERLAVVWDGVIGTCLVYTWLALPFILAYVDDTTPNWSNWLDLAVDVIFLIDVIVGRAQRRLNNVILVVLVLSLVPWYFIALLLPPRLYALAEFLQMLRLCKYLRLFRLARLTGDMQERQAPRYRRVDRRTVTQWRLMRLFVLVIMLTNLVAPAWIYVAVIQQRYFREHPRPTWLNQYDFDSRADGIPRWLHEYTVAGYWVLVTLCTIGYGDISPQNPLEMSFAIVIVLMSAISFSYVTGMFSSIVQQIDADGMSYVDKMAALSTFIETNHFPKQLRVDIFRYFNTVYCNERSHAGRRVDTKEFLRAMPTALRNTASMYIFRDITSRTPRLQGKPKSFITELIMAGNAIEFNDGEYIGRFGDKVAEWMVISSGQVAMTPPDSTFEIMVCEEGTTLGEIGIVLSDEWTSDARACGPVTVWAVPRPAVIELLRNQVEFQHEFRQAALDRFAALYAAVLNENRLDRRAQHFITLRGVDEDDDDGGGGGEDAAREPADDDALHLDVADGEESLHDRYLRLTEELHTRIEAIPDLAQNDEWLVQPLCSRSGPKSRAPSPMNAPTPSMDVSMSNAALIATLADMTRAIDEIRSQIQEQRR